MKSALVGGREIVSQEFEAIRETVTRCSGLNRAELAETLCEHLGWVTASGSGKEAACLKLKVRLDRVEGRYFLCCVPCVLRH